MRFWEETGFRYDLDVREIKHEESAYFPHAKLLPSSNHSGILEEEVPAPQTLHPDSNPSNKRYKLGQAILAAKAKAKAARRAGS